MKFEVIGFNSKDLWEKITSGREVYYQWQYIDAFCKNGDGEPRLAYAFDGDKYVMNVFFVRNIGEELGLGDEYKNYYDIATPYGYGGVDYDGENEALLDYYFEQFEEYCKDNNIVSEFVRLCPFTDNYKNYKNSKYDIKNISKTVHLKLEDPEQIWNDMEGRCRRTIKKALRNNLIVKSGFSKEMFDEFKDIYFDTMTRDNAEKYYFFNDEFYESIYNNLEKNSRVYTVYLDGKPISSTIALFGGKNSHYHLSGTLTGYTQLGANSLGIYQIALDMCKAGYKTLHLGGGYGGDDTSPLLQFKRSFNKNGDWDYYIGKRIFDKKAYDMLSGLIGVEKNEGFFPAYRKHGK